MISGVMIQPLKQIKDERGKVMQMLRADSPLFQGFGEVYFSMILPGKIKGWKKHTRMTQHFAVPVGKVILVIYDPRNGSLTHNQLQEIELGEENYQLVKVPPQVWYSFQGISRTPALIVNCSDIPHDPKEGENLDPFSALIPFSWGGK